MKQLLLALAIYLIPAVVCSQELMRSAFHAGYTGHARAKIIAGEVFNRVGTATGGSMQESLLLAGGPGTPLPAALLLFEGSWEADSILLSWHMGNESDVRAYHVEASVDARTFSLIGQVRPGLPGGKYHFRHKQAAPVSFYRLRIEKSGQTALYSRLIRIVSPTEQDMISVYPNPATSTLNFLSRQPTSLLLYDMLGSVVQHFRLSPGITSYSVSSVPRGAYVLRDPASSWSFRLMLR